MQIITHYHHRLYIALASVIILIMGIWLGNFLASTFVDNTAIINMEAIKIGLAFTTIILLLIVGSLVLEVKEILEPKKGGKK